MASRNFYSSVERSPSPKLSRQGVRRTLDSFYECLSLGLYGKTASWKEVKKKVWDKVSTAFFGCSVDDLAETITHSSPVRLPDGPMMAWKCRYARDWVNLCDPKNKNGRGEESYRMMFLNSSNQFKMARYIISHATESQSPDICFVGTVVCDCFNVGLVILAINAIKSRASVFSPSKENVASQQWAVETMMYVHLLQDGSYWDHLIEDKGGKFCVPKHVIHRLTAEDLFERAEDSESSETFRVARGSVYQVRVYDASLRKNIKVGDMIAPQRPYKVHYLEVDCTNVKDEWVFILWREGLSRPGAQLAERPLWIFVRMGDFAKCVSMWKRDITAPRFLMESNETAIYVVEADTLEEAVAHMRNQFRLQVKASL